MAGSFLLFGGVEYYPRGGAEDFKGRFDSIDAAKATLPERLDESERAEDAWGNGAGPMWAHVLDLSTGTIRERWAADDDLLPGGQLVWESED